MLIQTNALTIKHHISLSTVKNFTTFLWKIFEGK